MCNWGSNANVKRGKGFQKYDNAFFAVAARLRKLTEYGVDKSGHIFVVFFFKKKLFWKGLLVKRGLKLFNR